MTLALPGRWTASLLACALLLAACGPGTDDAAAVDLIDSEPTPLATTAPVALPPARAAVPSGEPAVESAVVVDAVPLPTETPTPQPTATTEPETPTPAPTAAPEPTVAAPPTDEPTALPTAEAAAQATSEPTSTPEPEVESPSTSEAEPPQAPLERTVTSLGYVTLGQAGEVPLVIPIGKVELIGFHEAGHPGSQAINAAGTGLPSMILESRSRGTAATSAADIVVPPGEPVRAPATGTVISANTYTLYCEHTDKLVYIEPDGLPGWVVKIFHVTGEIPAVGTRVIAGQSVVADGARQLPFESQVDEFTAEPSWPHVHVEVVDTSIPDTRPPGPGCP